MKNLSLITLTALLASGCWMQKKKVTNQDELSNTPLVNTNDATAPAAPTTVAKDKAGKSRAAFAGEVAFIGNPQVVSQYFAKNNATVAIATVDAELNMYKASFSADASVDKVVTDLRSQLSVVEPNYILSINDESNAGWPRDPEFFRLWGLNNIGQAAPKGLEGKARADMSLLKAWKETTGSSDVVVGVVDTGVDYTHTDLKDNIWVNKLEAAGTAGVDDDENGYTDDRYGWDFVSGDRTEPSQGGQPGDNDPMDDNSHGSHCSGTIGALANNNIGVVGVNWNVRIMPLKFLSGEGSGSLIDATRAILYAARTDVDPAKKGKKVDILSNSWGGGGEEEFLKSAIKFAESKGILFVAAAGNDSSNNDLTKSYPSGYDVDNVVAVGASDNLDNAATFSNYGQTAVDVFAPGVNVLSTIPVGKTAAGEQPYAAYSGTSMATPHVAGLAALVLSKNPDLVGKPKELKDRLIRSSDVVPSLIGKSVSNGRVNAYRAVTGSVGNVSLGEFVEEPISAFSSPAFPRVLTDVTKKYSKEGAKAVKLHFSFLQVEEPYDSVYIYDRDLRLVAHVENTATMDYWSPVVPGDTVYVRFANAKVRYTKQVRKPFSTPDEGFTAGASICEKDGTQTYCYVDDGYQDYFTFNSEGFTVDKLAFTTQSN